MIDKKMLGENREISAPPDHTMVELLIFEL